MTHRHREVLRDFWGITGEWLKFDGECGMLSHLPILAEWAQLGVVHAVQPVPVGGFSGGRIWGVSCEAGHFALRCWPSPGLPDARIRELHRFTRFLSQEGVDVVPVPATSSSGETLVHGQWQLEPWMPGAADFHAAPTPERLHNTMQQLARLHLASAGYESTSGGAAWFARFASGPVPAVRERRALILEWDESRVLDARRRVAGVEDERLRTALAAILDGYAIGAPCIGQRLNAMSEMQFALQPCIRDIWHDHVLFTGEQVTGLIDLAATRTENVASDLSRLLGSLLGDDFGRWNDALAAYESLRPLSGAERRLVDVLDQSGVLLSGLTWVNRLIQTEIAPGERARIAERIERIGARLASLLNRN